MVKAINTPGLAEQLAYYQARAGEYDQWWYRQGRYDRGPDLNARWFADVDELHQALQRFAPTGDVLELAGGTGIWSGQLLPYANRLTILDGAPEALAINRSRQDSERVEYIEANLFDWRPEHRFDIVFFSFWLSHVPPAAFADFWRLVRTCLAPGGRVFFIDSLKEATSTAVDHTLPVNDPVVRRRLNDGRMFAVYKIFHDPPELEQRLAGLGWNIQVTQTSRYFLYGHGAPADVQG